MRRRILAIGAATALALSGLALPAHAAEQAQLSVLHGVPESDGRRVGQRRTHPEQLQARHAWPVR